MKTESTILNSDLNSFARKYLVLGPDLTAEELANFSNTHTVVVASTLEQLMLFDKVSIKVYGENVPLTMLINQLGLNRVEKLIDEGALEFLLWTPMVGYNVTELPGILPLMSGNTTSSVHVDPEESATTGLQWLSNGLSERQAKGLIKKVRDIYRIPDKEFARNSANLVMDAYKSNRLAEYGMPMTKDLANLTLDERKQLSGYAQTILETTILSSLKYSSFENYNDFLLSSSTFARIEAAIKIKENANKILTLENIPDLKSVFIEENINLDKLLKLRAKNDARRFREWLFSVSTSSDAKEITKEYVDALVDSKGFFETKGGKFVKTMSMYSLGTGVGTLIGGLPGTLLGGTVGKILEPAADIGLDMLDTYFLDGLLRGWNPRIFLDKLKDGLETKQDK